MASQRDSIVDSFMSKKTPQVLAALAATIGAFSMGAVEGWTSPGLPSLKESGDLGELSIGQSANIASLALLAALISGPPTGMLIQNFGRKTTMIGLSIPFITGWLLIAFSKHINMMFVGRFLTGFCAGACSLAVPVYIGETAEDSVRGTLGSGFQLMVTMGNLFVYIVGTFLAWNWLAIVCAVVPVISVIFMVLVPPSPRYLLTKGRVDEASKALVWLRGAASSRQVDFELQKMQYTIEKTKAQEATWGDLLKPEILKPISVSLGLMLFQQLSGIEAVLVYTVDIFEAGDPKIDSNLAAILVGVFQVIGTLTATILVDRLGRRILLMVSSVTMSIAMITLGIYFYTKVHNPSLAITINWLPLLTMFLFIIAFAIGFGPIAWMMTPEIIPNQAIGIGSALCTTFNWTLAYLVAYFFPTVSHSVGYEYCFAVFACFSVLAALFVFFFVPETKGKSLEEIQKHFSSKKNKIVNNSKSSDSHNTIITVIE